MIKKITVEFNKNVDMWEAKVEEGGPPYARSSTITYLETDLYFLLSQLNELVEPKESRLSLGK